MNHEEHTAPDLTQFDETFAQAEVQDEFEPVEDGIAARSEVRCVGPTGVEMEALTAVGVALLTVYDMCKAVDREMVVSGIRLVEKRKEEPPG